MRKVIITKSHNLIGWEHLAKHSLVRRRWRLPREYTLIVVDPTAETTGSVCLSQKQMAVAHVEEASLFAPFYRRTKSLAEISTLHLTARTTSYHFVADSRSVLQYPAFRVFPDWETSNVIQIRCLLRSNLTGRCLFLQSIFAEWAIGMRGLQELRLFSPVISDRRQYVVTCGFGEACGDATMALLMLLSDTRAATCLRSVAFCPPPLDEKPRANNSQPDTHALSLARGDIGRGDRPVGLASGELAGAGINTGSKKGALETID
jgi:hypothetical protein